MKLLAFILAAGFGERLRPITDHIPKPLLPILGKPILQSILERVSSLPINKIGINLHHKKKVIENWISQSAFSKSGELFPEDPILGTGGALKNAESFLSGNTFLVHNSDIISDIDLKKLIDYHLLSKNLVTLAVHDYHEFNNLIIDENGYLIDIQHEILKQVQNDTTKNLKAFTGIAVYGPEFLKFLPSGISSVVDIWIRAIKSGYRIGTFDVSGCYWTDIGTPVSFAKAVVNELRKNGEMVYIDPAVKRCKYVEMDGYVVIENESTINKGVSIRNCIMLSRSHTKSDSHYENCILGPGFKIDLKESEILSESLENNKILIGTGGSDRKYYRIKTYGRSKVLMKCTPEDLDFQRHIEYTRFFKKYSIPVPELINVETDNRSASFEDLGGLSLYDWLKCPREQEDIEKIYKQVIDISILIHTLATEHVSECPLLQKRIFDYKHLRWETNYFIERFVEGIRNIKVKKISALEDEFHRLAMKVDSFHKTVIHRDFQSQNIMITKGGIPKLVDYQGARIGPPAYDVVSLLWDPYYRLDEGLRERLLDYYINKVISLNPSLSPFNHTLLPCRLQRHMQALGAYGFLSTAKEKKYFLKYIPEGFRLLKEEVTLSKNEYPELYELVMNNMD